MKPHIDITKITENMRHTRPPENNATRTFGNLYHSLSTPATEQERLKTKKA